LPMDNSALATAAFIQSALDGQIPVPAPLAQQVSVLCRLAQHMGATSTAPSLP